MLFVAKFKARFVVQFAYLGQTNALENYTYLKDKKICTSFFFKYDFKNKFFIIKDIVCTELFSLMNRKKRF